MMEWRDDAILRVRVKRKVTLAVMVIDDLTGQPIKSADLQLSCAQTGRPPVRKSDGYFLFLDCDGEELTITAKAYAYHGHSITVNPESLPPLHPVVNLRLTPNRNYAIPQNTTCIEGTAKGGTTISVYCENHPKPLRLLYDYSKSGESDGRQIQLYDPSGQNHEGRQFVLLAKGEKTPVNLTITDMVGEEGDYRMATPLGKNYPKAGTTLLPVSTVTAGGDGKFFLPLPTLAVQSYTCILRWTDDKGKEQVKTQEIPCGKVTSLHLGVGE